MPAMNRGTTILGLFIPHILFPVLFSLALFLWPNLALADTIITGQITSDTTWSPAGGVYIIDSNFSVASGTTLTIEPGTIVKGKFTSANRPSIFGRLVAHGTAGAPIYFTSIYDDSVGGDTDGTGPTEGNVGIWQGLYFEPGSEGDLEHVNFSYAGAGGFGYGEFVGIKNDGGTLNINNSYFSNNYQNSFDWSIGSYRSGFTIFNKGTLSIKNSIFTESGFGIYSEVGTTTIENSVIKNNTHVGFVAGESLDPVTLINNKFIGNKKTASVSAMRLFIHDGNTSEDLSYKGFEMTGYTRDGAVLHSRDLPIIQGPYVQSGVTVNIEPGTVIKVGQDGRTGIYVYGKLNMLGTKEEKIYVTSLADDSLMGDTNGDGNATSPGIKNWNAFFLEDGSEANFDNVVMKYGGFNYNGEYMPGVAASIYARDTKLSIKNSVIDDWSTTIFQDAGTVNITDSKLISGNYGIYFRGGEFKISNSDLSQNTGIAMFNQSGSYPNTSVKVMDARNNWWGDASGPWNASTSTPTGSGVRIDGNNILYSPWLGTPPTDITECCSSVLFIPGFMASDLYVQSGITENKLWPPNSLTKSDVEKLMLDSGGNPVTSGIYTKNPIDEAFGFNVYKSFMHNMNDLVTNQGIDEWRAFPYDWRKNISQIVSGITVVKNGNNFENRKLIDEAVSLAERSPTGKITIVGHSNGGLVGKELIKQLFADGKGDIVDKFIMVAVPQIGTPKAIASLLHGDQQEIPPFVGFLMNKELAKELAYNMQSAHNLIPSQKYFEKVSDPVIKFNNSINQIFSYTSDGLPQSISDYENMTDFLVSNNRGVRDGDATNVPAILRLDLVTNANTNISSISNWVIPSTVELYEIAGFGEDTIKGIDYRSKKENICSTQNGISSCQAQSVWDRRLLMTRDGDGTVVLPSATNEDNTSEYYLNLFNHNKGYGLNLRHHNILEASSLTNLLNYIFTENISDALPQYISLEKPVTSSKSLQLSVHSPVSIEARDSQGRFTGVNNSFSSDGFTFVKEEIPNSYYLEIAEDKYIGLDQDRDYTINLKGTGVGTFTLNQEVFDGGNMTESENFVNIPVTPLMKISFDIDDGALAKNIDIDTDGNGIVDIQIDSGDEFNPVNYLNVMKSVISLFGLERSQETDLLTKINNVIKSIQNGEVQKASSKAETFVKKLNLKLAKIDEGENPNRKLTEEEMLLIIQNLEEFILNLK